MLPPMKRLALLVLVAATACSGSSSTKGGATPCTGLPTVDPGAAMPAGLPPIDGQVLYEPSTQGKTHIVYGLLKTTDFVKVRDDYVTALKGAGWKIDGTDQESVEAEAQFSKGPPLQAGTVKIAPLDTCKGYVTVRYKLNE
ncbi:MAG: hypothetical protein JWO22_1079 [Frankiales bacterium]|nr:hypothetical protein [Frankiales bacterium]